MIKVSRFFLIAFALNSLFLIGLNFEDTWEFLNSTVNFNVTILPAGSGQPPLPPPANESPANGNNVLLPLVCRAGSVSIADAQIEKIQWVFRRNGIPNYDPPFLLAETIGNNKTFNAPDGIFTVGETYYWKARYVNLQNTWSSYSGETGFTVIAAPVVVTPVASSGGYSGGYSGSGYSGGFMSPLPSFPQPQPTPPAPKAPVSVPPAKKTPQEPSVQKIPVSIKLKKNKIPKNQPLRIGIFLTGFKWFSMQPTPKSGAVKSQTIPIRESINQIRKLLEAKTMKESMNLDIQIRSSSGESVLKKRETIEINETKIDKNLGDMSVLPVGNYVVSFSYEKDGTVFAVSDNLEITPRAPFQEFAATVLLWNEGFLPILFISSLAVLYFRRGRKNSRDFRRI